MTQLNKRTDKKYAVRKAGRRPANAQALIENKSPEWGESLALSYSVLFIALIGIVFPWKRMECQERCVALSAGLSIALCHHALNYCTPSPYPSHYHHILAEETELK